MAARGIILVTLGALGTAVLIGLDLQGPAATAVAIAAGAGTLALFFIGTIVLRRSRSDRAEVARVDELADDTEQEARVHLLEGREAELLRQIHALETRRDEVLAQTAAAALARSEAPATPKPNLRVISGSD